MQDPELDNAIRMTIADVCIALNARGSVQDCQIQSVLWRVMSDLSALRRDDADMERLAAKYRDASLVSSQTADVCMLTSAGCFINRARISCRIAQRLARGSNQFETILSGIEIELADLLANHKGAI